MSFRIMSFMTNIHPLISMYSLTRIMNSSFFIKKKKTNARYFAAFAYILYIAIHAFSQFRIQTTDCLNLYYSLLFYFFLIMTI